MLRRCRLCAPEREFEAAREGAACRVNPVIDACRRLGTLTEREREVLAAMPGGESNADMALALGISERTVKFHVMNLREKLGGLSRLQLHLLALLAETVMPAMLRVPHGDSTAAGHP